MKTKVLKYAKGYGIPFAVPVVTYGVVALVCLLGGASSFFTSTIMSNMVYKICYTAMLGMGIMIPLLSGRMDFTSGVTPTLACIIAMHFTWSTMGTVNVAFIMIFSVVFSVIITMFSYGINILARIPMMISSLGLVMVYEAICNAFGGMRFSTYFSIIDPYFSEIKQISAFPTNVIIAVAVLIVLWFLLYKTKYGKDTFSLAADPRLAVNSGVNQVKNLLLTSVIVGIVYGIGGVWYVLSPTLGDSFAAPSGMSSVFVTFGALAGVLICRYLATFSGNIVWGIICGSITMMIINVAITCFRNAPTSTDIIVSGTVIIVFSAYQANEAAVRLFFSSAAKKIAGLFRRKVAKTDSED